MYQSCTTTQTEPARSSLSYSMLTPINPLQCTKHVAITSDDSNKNKNCPLHNKPHPLKNAKYLEISHFKIEKHSLKRKEYVSNDVIPPSTVCPSSVKSSECNSTNCDATMHHYKFLGSLAKRMAEKEKIRWLSAEFAQISAVQVTGTTHAQRSATLRYTQRALRTKPSKPTLFWMTRANPFSLCFLIHPFHCCKNLC